MSRHVVLLRRDPSLGLALRALLHGTGRVTELLTIHGWSALPAETIDAVVIDLPTPRRTQAIDLIRSHFDGRLVLVLDPSDDPAAIPPHHHCSILQRPFEIVELWQLVTTDPTPGRSANGERGAAGEERASAQQGEGRPEPAAAGAPAASGDEPGRTPAGPATHDEGGPPGVDASTWRWRGRRYGPATAIPPDSPGPGPGPGDARPGARTGEPTGAAGPSAAPAAGAHRGPATQDRPPGSRGDEPRSEGRGRGAVPRRSADPPSGDQPGPEPQIPGGPRSSTSESTPLSADSGRPRPTARPGSPASSPTPEERSTEGPAPDQVARRTAPSGPGGADRPAGSPATGEPSPADAGPERPSLFRRLSSRLGGHKPEVEVENSTTAETSTEVRSASVPAFEPPLPPPEGSPQQTGPPVWPAPEVQARSGQGDLRPSSATPPAERPATSGPAAAPPQTPVGPTAPPTSSTPDRTPGPPRRSAPPLRPTRPGSASRPQGPFRPTRPSARPARRPSPSQPPRTAEPPPPTRREADAPRASEPHRPKDQARPAREEVAPAARGPVQPDDGPQPAGKEPTPTRQPQPAATQAKPDRTEPGPAAAPAEAVPADRAGPVPVTSGRDETREQPEPQAASDEPKQAAAGAEPDPEVVEAQPAPTTVRDEPDSGAVAALADPAPVPSANAVIDPAPPPPGKGPDPKRRSRGRQPSGGLPPMPTWPSLPPTGPIPAGGAPAEESDRPRRQQPAARSQPAQPAAQTRPTAAQTRPTAAPSSAQPTAPPEAPPPGRPPGRDPEAAETKPRPGSGPLGVAPDGPEALLAAAEAAAAAPGPLLGTPARPPGTVPTETDEGATTPGQAPPDRRQRGRRARSLLRFTAPRRPDQTERDEPSSPDEPQPLADFDRLTHSIESVTEALGGQPLEFYERDLPQIAAAETARRVRADVVVLLLDNGEGLMEVSGGVGLTPAERRLNVEYSRDVMRELFRAGVGLVEDTDRVRGALAGIPGSRAETLVMVPLVHERLGFGVLMAGRNRSQTGVPTEVFTDAEIEVLMGFADAAAASLRTAVLLRHLKGQLKALEEDD